ncbi:MAG TPA: ATP-binding protein [Cyclobacteriaceae bacterium]|jgi:serine/threonine-protein kinase RsbW|nr:ATP-binding protein [Cyclobacteriaceae bacterium]MBX7089729.1 ATP-binding protein [Cyclobacteriaceae bacterium]HMV07761.1 ATP-binding protein [Cyclobacteriaceae bacterium]HMV88029.1 ATP-binding protein [Cyclobacteriaceae bacterium]HMW98896.1 ATP-binding protein [Cyclobacteriaceae bacterium]
MNTISIQIPSIVENIRMIESFIDNAKERFHLDEDLYGNIMIAVTEAVNNAIRHGNSGNSAKNVFLSLTLHDNLLKFIVKDEGPGFNYEQLPDPTAPENLEKPGGRGIFLMKHLSDEVEFRENGKTVELSFYMNS